MTFAGAADSVYARELTISSCLGYTEVNICSVSKLALSIQVRQTVTRARMFIGNSTFAQSIAVNLLPERIDSFFD